ncbi:hypothetical protein QA612_02820 [Evansella sp. AB-P1]|uniref:hypothetical protein n=1 Tax=Evansella sp. AB-P1 TaxID=3037653 RepID=UPI00241F8D6E|nr:hypothetical protein [Evansella sp. AB-P1]MDG5786408.1 hypothetical protein [Evansella sp. AB-P1]
MSKTSYLYGFIIGGTIASATTLLTTTKPGEAFRNDLVSFQQEFLTNWNSLKKDISELLIKAKDLKETTIRYINEKLPEIMDRIHMFKDELKPHLIEIKEQVFQLQHIVENLRETLYSYKEN